ncbi:hypothetical protein V5O48_016661 [Marasmius crinis-equi]|uniref:GATA-type domain-containing protein n=1 Tax=Marasmius crinis-equi TaxID=585013 RepID=A0ABR3ER33_9AGAR
MESIPRRASRSFFKQSASSIAEPGSETTSPRSSPSTGYPSHAHTPDLYDSDAMADDIKEEPLNLDLPQYKRRNGSRGKKGRGPREKPPGVLMCANCKATSSPEWRRGPSGLKDLCNACGLRYATSKKKGGYDFTRVMVKSIRESKPHFTPTRAEKMCSNCMTTSSPEWRKGPTGEKDLCNACGLRFARKGNFIASSLDSTSPPSSACVCCRTTSTPEWRRGPSGNKDLCNACGLRYARTGQLSSGSSSPVSSAPASPSHHDSDDEPTPSEQRSITDLDHEEKRHLEKTLLTLFYCGGNIFPPQRLIHEWANQLQINYSFIFSWVRREQEKIRHAVDTLASVEAAASPSTSDSSSMDAS